jgi:hypothetical protein
MIKRISQNHACNYHFSEFFPNLRTKYLFISQFSEEHPDFHKINAHILESFFTLDIPSITSDDMDARLKDFFLELNWRCYSMFNKLPVQEKGLSLLLLIQRDDQMWLVQFGRMLCGISSLDECREEGVSWSNFVVKTKSDLLLLGGLGEDIFPKVLHPQLLCGEQLFMLPYPATRELQCSSLCQDALHTTLDALLEPGMLCHLVYQAQRDYNGATPAKKRRKRR